MTRRFLGALVIAIALAIPGPAWAQAELWLTPVLGQLMTRGDYGWTFYPDERVSGQETDFSLTQHRVSLFAPLWQDSQDEWSVSASLRLQEFDTRAVLPDTGDSFPEELWDARLGVTYRHRFDNGWIAGGNVTVGSASDRLFDSSDELIIRATGFLRVPSGERNAWFFTLNYVNHYEAFAGLPLPGVAYVYAPSDRLQAIIGVPFSAIEFRPLEKTTFQLTYVPIRRVRVRVTQQVFRPLRVYAGFDWDHDLYLRADRPDKDDQLFYYEKRLTLGARFDLRHFGIEALGGYAFDRFYFEGESYSDRRDNRIDVGAGPFVSIRASIRF
ncbi:MAG: hypothetical protein ACREJ9_07260 [Candidatus Rokuibacteriota bacterium]